MAKQRESDAMARLPDGQQRNWPLVRALMAEVARLTDQWVVEAKELELEVDHDLSGRYDTWEDAEIDMGEHLRDVADTKISCRGTRGGQGWYVSIHLSEGRDGGWGSSAIALGPIKAECDRYVRVLQTFVTAFLRSPTIDARHIPAIEHLHPEVREASLSRLFSGHADDAVEQACKTVGARLRRMSGLHDDGKRLVAAALGGSPPPVTVADLGTPTGLNEQEGYLHLGMALFQAGRNPRAHRPAGTSIDLAETMEWLSVASLLHRALDNASK